MASSRVAMDHLAHERVKAEFDVGAMKLVWAGSEHAFDIVHRMSRLIASNPVFSKEDRPMQGQKELLKNAARSKGEYLV